MKILDQTIPQLIREQAEIFKRRTDLNWCREAAELIYSDCILNSDIIRWFLNPMLEYDELGLCKAVFKYYNVEDVYEPLYNFLAECKAKQAMTSSL